MSDEVKTIYDSREKVPEKYRWQLEDIFPSVEAWEASLLRAGQLLNEAVACRGSIKDGRSMLAALELDSRLDLELSELMAYARMRRDLDNSDSQSQDMVDRATGTYYQAASAMAFLTPEIAALPAADVLSWLEEIPELKPFRHQVRSILHLKEHILDEAGEALLSGFGPVIEGIADTYTMLDNVDMDLGAILDEQGREIRLTHARFGELREHKNRQVRSDAFARVHEAYARSGQTLSMLYSTQVKADLALARARGYADTLEAALYPDHLPRNIYTSLVETVNRGLPELHRYYRLRSQLMGLDPIHIYDTYVPVFDMPTRQYTYEEACSIVREALLPLGDEYMDVLDEHLSRRWIDVFETPGKTNGAYSWGTYRSHPYILLNFSGTLSDVFTLAHELGHSLHSRFSQRRPWPEAQYTIFLAEIASTVNENLLVRHLLGKCDPRTDEGRREQDYLANHFLESFRQTVFRQTMFAEFELSAHRRAEAGESLTSEQLCSVYAELLRRYFGPQVAIDDYMRWEWARIPHFYSPYYVYKYATGFSAAIALSNQLLAEETASQKRYLEFLGSGGADTSLNILARAGIDMSTPAPVAEALAVFSEMLDRLAASRDKVDSNGN